MKIGVSTYSLSRAIISGEMTVTDAIAHIAEIGGQHVEIVPIGYSLTDNPGLIDDIVRKAKDVGLDISGYAIGANFAVSDEIGWEREIERVKREVDISARLGVKKMRHDVVPFANKPIPDFLADLPRLAEACREIADYAKRYGITTSVENHGYNMQGSDRVLALLHEVNRPNFRLTVDIGNFMCTDENSVAAVKKTISSASMVHIKDFYLRPFYRNPGPGWFPTESGNHLRGAVTGHGDIDMPEVLRIIKQSGYDDYLSLEFEGLEECKQGTKLGLDYLKATWAQIE